MASSRAFLAALLLALAASGCVERRFLLRTDPEGARVTVNGQYAGTTPLDMPFEHYGEIRIEILPPVEEGQAFADWRRLVTSCELDAPWYQWFPLDFFSDNLVPWTIVDRHAMVLRLERKTNPDDLTEEELKAASDDLARRARDLRIRAGKARTEAELESGKK